MKAAFAVCFLVCAITGSECGRDTYIVIVSFCCHSRQLAAIKFQMNSDIIVYMLTLNNKIKLMKVLEPHPFHLTIV